MKANFYSFFFPSPSLNRNEAIRSIVAGSIAGGFLVLISAIRTAYWLQLEGWYSEHVGLGLSALVIASSITVLTWNRIVIGPILGILATVVLCVWMILRGDIVALGLLAPLFVGGFWSASRGISFLRMNGTGP